MLPRDRIWLWGHAAGSHNGRYNLPGESRITPGEAARCMGIDNVVMVVFRNNPSPPFTEAAADLAGAQRLVWSIVGDASSKRNDEEPDLTAVCDLARRYPSIRGAIMDDFFLNRPGPDGRQARWSLDDIKRYRKHLHAQPNPLDLWVVMYDHAVDRPLGPYLEACDVVTFWTWQGEDLEHLEENFARLETVTPGTRKVLGCYMWDFGKEGGGREIPAPLMEKQCRLAGEWLASGRIEGIIFLASCICDLPIEGVTFVKDWLAGQ